MKIMVTQLAIFILGLLVLLGCGQKEQNLKPVTLVLKHGKIAGDPILFRNLLDKFERENPGIIARDEPLPASSDEQHQFFVINLEGKSSDFDVLSMDVIWVPEFARAGWVRDLSSLVPEKERADFFSGPMEAVMYEGKPYAIPWYIDAGLLYYRKDLLKKYGFSPPSTWPELVSAAQAIISKEKGLYGFIWQGKQYEGLVCNALEYMWSHGGGVLKAGQPVLFSPENISALTFMRNLITKYKVTPPLVTTAIEEPTRHIFGNGQALFMRNWPYAWTPFQQEGSPVRDRVGISTLPHFPGYSSASALGGWQLGINRFSKNPQAAEKLVLFLTSPESQKILALDIGYKPSRRSLYQDKELIKKQPFIAGLAEVMEKARPRPVTPYYMLISQVLQVEFSAVLTGMKTPREALESAQKQVASILRENQ